MNDHRQTRVGVGLGGGVASPPSLGSHLAMSAITPHSSASTAASSISTSPYYEVSSTVKKYQVAREARLQQQQQQHLNGGPGSSRPRAPPPPPPPSSQLKSRGVTTAPPPPPPPKPARTSLRNGSETHPHQVDNIYSSNSTTAVQQASPSLPIGMRAATSTASSKSSLHGLDNKGNCNNSNSNGSSRVHTLANESPQQSAVGQHLSKRQNVTQYEVSNQLAYFFHNRSAFFQGSNIFYIYYPF